MPPERFRRASRSRVLALSGVVVALVGVSACFEPEEVRTEVFLRAFDTDGEPLERARIRFRDADGRAIGEGELVRENGFRFESERLGETGDWGRRVRTADIESGSCSGEHQRVAGSRESIRVAAGGHPSLGSKRITRYELRATLICAAAPTEESRREHERKLREGDVRSRIRAAVELGWLQPPEGADEELEAAFQDAAAIALGLVHHPDPSALPELIAALHDDRERVRLAAAVLLAKLGRNEHGVAREALPALAALRDDPSEPVRVVAEYAVTRITPRRAPLPASAPRPPAS